MIKRLSSKLVAFALVLFLVLFNGPNVFVACPRSKNDGTAEVSAGMAEASAGNQSSSSQQNTENQQISKQLVRLI